MKYLFSFVIVFVALNAANSQDLMVLKTSGKVIIGDTSQITTPGPYNLYVQNGMMTEKVKVAVKSAGDWSDDAFTKTPELDAVKESIDQNSHLYNMPSADKLVKEGYELQAMDAKIVEQVEWLWQHTIKLAEENKTLKAELEEIKKQLAKKN